MGTSFSLHAPTLGNKRLYRYQQEYLIPLLKDAVARGIKIKCLVDKSADKEIDHELLIDTSNYDTEIQILDLQQHSKIIAIIVDKEVCLTVEVRDKDDDYDEYDSAVEVLGLATYSNSESTVSSYTSIFDTLWIQAELKDKKDDYVTIMISYDKANILLNVLGVPGPKPA